MEKLIERYKSLLDNTSTDFLRYLHSQINWDARMIAILGSRGVGKTTLLLQHIKLHLPVESSLYVNADDIYFSTHTLLDLAENYYHQGGKYLLIDEIHKYQEWSRELKLMYDYFPNLNVIFTGSSVLEIFKGASDLSRRVSLYMMYGMSFREYLNFTKKTDIKAVSINDIMEHKVKIDGVDYPLLEFKTYLRKGYYPFFVQPDYENKLMQTVQTVLETDIPMYAKMNTSSIMKIKRLLGVIAESVPFKPNFSKIALMLEVNRDTLSDYVSYMIRAGLLNQLFNETSGVRTLGKVDKIYLQNTNLVYALKPVTADVGNVRETFFLNQMMVSHEVLGGVKADFVVDEKYTFEIGGDGKNQKQIAGLADAYIVKDDILYGANNVLPLWHFGLLY